MLDSNLYIISFGDHEFFKLGISADPTARLRTLQHQSPKRLAIVATIPIQRHHAFAVESIFHARMKDYRTFGEWYNAPLAIISKELENVLTIYTRSANYSRTAQKLQRMQSRVSCQTSMAELLFSDVSQPLSREAADTQDS